ncbi:MAG: hypothetical protein R2727_07880 [Bacteroidales bacterium]
MSKTQNLENLPVELFRKKIFLSMLVPVSLVVILWVIRFIESELGVSLRHLGIFPLEARGLPGIITSPLVHADIKHLFNNSIPLLVLGSVSFLLLFRCGSKGSCSYMDCHRGTCLGQRLTGMAHRCQWNSLRSASFLFVSGIIRRYIRLTALSTDSLSVWQYGLGDIPVL